MNIQLTITLILRDNWLLLRYFYHKGHKVLNKETQGAVYFLDTYLPIILKEFLVFLVFSSLPLW